MIDDFNQGQAATTNTHYSPPKDKQLVRKPANGPKCSTNTGKAGLLSKGFITLTSAGTTTEQKKKRNDKLVCFHLLMWEYEVGSNHQLCFRVAPLGPRLCLRNNGTFSGCTASKMCELYVPVCTVKKSRRDICRPTCVKACHKQLAVLYNTGIVLTDKVCRRVYEGTSLGFRSEMSDLK